jgi:hypothetical protein
MTFDALAELKIAGEIDRLSAAQQDVLRGLSPAEVATINNIKARLDEVTDEVEGHTITIGVVLY